MLYTEILKDSSVFTRVYKRGGRALAGGAVGYFLKNNRPYNRFGITVGKKVGGAVERNRAKRIIRAAYRKNELLLPIGYDIVIVARGDTVEMKSFGLDPFFKKLAREIEKSSEKNSH